MGFLDRLRGVPDAVARPVVAAPSHLAARHGSGDFDMGAATEPVAPVTRSADEEVDRLIMAGQLIAAIKAHRQVYGTGLKESKDAVEARRDQLERG